MQQIRIQRYIAILSVVLFVGKFIAWQLTHSVTVLTDAMESIVNMVAGFIGLYAIILAAKPRDTNHPYGHGKAEFLSSAVEGTLIVISGVLIIYEAVQHLLIPGTLERLDIGMVIIAVAGAINFFAGRYAEKKGEKHHSLIMVSAGKHLQTDAYSTVGVIAGLIVIYFTQNRWPWLDSAVGLCFSLIIIITGYRVLRRSLSGIMDEIDVSLMKKIIELLQDKREAQWVDLHNLRVIRYGTVIHVDAHMTLPWYYQVADADNEIHRVEQLIKSHFGDDVEVFIHIDGCKPYQCKLCALEPCPERQEPLKGRLDWDIENLWKDAKHGKVSDN